MTNLHDIKTEKKSKKYKFSERTVDLSAYISNLTFNIDNLNDTFRNYYINYPTSGIATNTYLNGTYTTTTEFTVPMTELDIEYVTREQYLSANFVPNNWRVIADGTV